MSWSSLPEELWKLILVNVPLPERLGNCSRVSKKLCRAAAAATEQLEVKLRNSQQRSEGFVLWLQQKVKHVTSVVFIASQAALTELPCRQLRQLVVSNGRVQLGPSSSHPGVLHSCSSLTKLKLCVCRVVDWPSSLTALSAVPGLQHLELMELKLMELMDDYDSATRAKLNLPGNVLQVLTQLTLLSLDSSIEVTAESLQHISALQQLQVLDLCSGAVSLSPSSTPGLAQLTALHKVRLNYATLDAALLQHYTQLQHLKLLWWSSSSAAGSGAVLLSVIGQKLQLQQLVLKDWKGCDWPTAAVAYTAFTASSRLQELTLQLGKGLPAGICQALFRPEQQLPLLQKLELHCRGAATDNEGAVPPPAAFSSTDIRRLAACCPGLQVLNIDLQPDVQLAALSQLTALTRLTIEATESSVKSLSSLSRLRSLDINGSAFFSPAALLPLTALRLLTWLGVGPVDFDDGGDTVLNLHSQMIKPFNAVMPILNSCIVSVATIQACLCGGPGSCHL